MLLKSMKKFLILSFIFLSTICHLQADWEFFTQDGKLTADCKELFDALNLPKEIVDAETLGRLWESQVIDFLHQNSWMDGEYRNKRGDVVNFDKVIDLLEKLKVITCSAVDLIDEAYDYVVIMSDNAVEARLNARFWQYLVNSDKGHFLVDGMPVLLFQNGRSLLSVRDSRAAFKCVSSGLLRDYVRYIWEHIPEEFNRFLLQHIFISYCVEPSTKSLKGTDMMDILQVMVNGDKRYGKIGGNILVICSNKNLSEKREQIENIVFVPGSNITNCCVMGYSVVPLNGWRFNCCHNIEPFSCAVFNKLTELIYSNFRLLREKDKDF